MPLTPAAPRERLHTRDIQIIGYRRDDGLYDIEAQLSDTKAYGFVNQFRGFVRPGDKLHGLWLRLTVDETMTIVASEAAMDDTPYAACAGAAPTFAGLTGLRIRSGFLREAAHRVGGPAGCTHLRELLQQMATAAFQTINSYRVWRETQQSGETLEPGSDALDKRISERMPGGHARMVDTCRTYAADGEVVRKRWPELYTGADAAKAAE